MYSRTLWRHQEHSSNQHIGHKRLDDWKLTPTKCRQDRNNAFQFIKTQASTCTSFDLPSHHFLLRLSQEPRFLPRHGSLYEENINFICKAAFLEIRRISTIHHYLTDDAKKTLVVSHVLSHIDYCNSLLACLPQSLVGKLQRVQNCAARLVVRAPPRVHITPVQHLHWLPVRARISHKTACLCFNTIASSTPSYLSDLLHLCSPSPSLRSSADTRLLKIPLYKFKTKGDRALSYFGPTVWNSLPLHIRKATTNDTFKSALENYLYNFQESY